MIVLITGASSGVGLHAAEAFAESGADVALLARGEDGLYEAAERVHAAGRRALVLPADVTDRAAVEAAVERTVADLGGLDVVVSNAAATVHGHFADVEADAFDAVVATTLIGPVNLIRAALPHLERSGGTVVAVGSLVSRVPLPTFTSYAAAKAGLRHFLHSLRIELRAQRSPVRIAQLHPGLIDTPLWDHTAGELPRRPPEGYDPREVADAIVELARNPRPERIFGAETKLLDIVWRRARPVGDLILALFDRYLRSKPRGAPEHDPLRQAAGHGDDQGNLPLTRPSLRHQLGRLVR